MQDSLHQGAALVFPQIPLENGKPADGPDTVATTTVLSSEFPRMEMTNSANGIEVLKKNITGMHALVARLDDAPTATKTVIAKTCKTHGGSHTIMDNGANRAGTCLRVFTFPLGVNVSKKKNPKILGVFCS